MKKLYFLVVLFVVGSVNGQVIDFPDANFKAILLGADTSNTIAKNLQGEYFKIDANNDGEIDVSEALNVLEFSYVASYEDQNAIKISDCYGLSNFINLERFDCINNLLTNLDLSTSPNLRTLNCSHNQISSLNIEGLINLEILMCEQNQITNLNLNGMNLLRVLYCDGNQLSTLDLSFLTSLEYLTASYNQLTALDFTYSTYIQQLQCMGNMITTLDVSNLNNLELLMCGYNPPLTSIFMKNGKQESLNLLELPNLTYICADESHLAVLQLMIELEGYNCTLNSYCSFTPGGESYEINGNTFFDTNNNGCDLDDMMQADLKFNITNGTETGTIISNQSDEYSVWVQTGTHTIVPILENPTFFSISPATVAVTFPETTSPFTQNFCITPNGLHPDLEVTILPTTPARPGFDAEYKILIKNKGNIQQSGSVSFAYDDTVLDYEIATPVFTTQAEGLLSWAFANLDPFETREINVTLNVNSPMETPAVNGDDVLTYTATISSEATDELPLDNTFSLPQIVVNSFDPNDKTCLEGTAISPDMIGQYVHYMIRFENTGTFAAENIVVKDMIDTAKFDVSSLVALNGSHPYVTRITGNKVEFIFENINLPFDDANNDGYVVFKIKTLPTLVLGDSFSNTASIYFDYNHPIITEPAVTTFADLDTKDFEFNNYLTLYPNPTSGILNITYKQDIEMQSISIYNVLWQMVVAVPNAKGVNNVDVSSLSTGNYFIKIVSDKGTSNAKFVKN